MKIRFLSLFITLLLITQSVMPVYAGTRHAQRVQREERQQTRTKQQERGKQQREVTPTPTPTLVTTPTPSLSDPTPTPTGTPMVEGASPTPTPAPNLQPTPVVTTEPMPTTVGSSNQKVNQNSGTQKNIDNQEGKAAIQTGEVEGAVMLNNEVSQNTVGASAVGRGGGDHSTTIANEGNAAESTNSGEIDENNTTKINLQNSTRIQNDVEIDLNTGHNKIRDNLSGDGSSVKTGDATATVNVINLANTNLVGVSVSSQEHNVTKARTDDLDLSGGGGVAVASGEFGCGRGGGCGGEGSVGVINDKNGGGSQNSGVIKKDNTLIITNDNYAQVDNEININLDTGNNLIADSLGDANIETGDANVVVGVFNLINTGLVGIKNLALETVNILADFTGNIILPRSKTAGGSGGIKVSNSQNGAESTNTAEITQISTSSVEQSNTAEINNVIKADISTGNNKVKDNINGDGDGNQIQTGSVKSVATATTVANQNYVGDDINVVFLNQEGQMSAYYVEEDGSLTNISGSGKSEVSNGKNGIGSTNRAEIEENNAAKINQDNRAYINNTIHIDANTGGNKIKDNIDGGARVKTGDVNIFSNVVNFINNNFIAPVVRFIVVNDPLGLWSGNFTSDSQKEKDPPSKKMSSLQTHEGGYAGEIEVKSDVTPNPEGLEAEGGPGPESAVMVAGTGTGGKAEDVELRSEGGVKENKRLEGQDTADQGQIAKTGEGQEAQNAAEQDKERSDREDSSVQTPVEPSHEKAPADGGVLAAVSSLPPTQTHVLPVGLLLTVNSLDTQVNTQGQVEPGFSPVVHSSTDIELVHGYPLPKPKPWKLFLLLSLVISFIVKVKQTLIPT